MIKTTIQLINMCKLKNSEVILTSPNLCTAEKWKLLCFSNALLANLIKSGSSQGGFIFSSGSNTFTPLAWK